MGCFENGLTERDEGGWGARNMNDELKLGRGGLGQVQTHKHSMNQQNFNFEQIDGFGLWGVV